MIKIKPCINAYNWVGMFSIWKRWLEKVGKNNVTIALNVSYTKKMHLAYVFQHNSNREKLVILLMIPDREKYEGKSKGWEQWHYLAVKKDYQHF